MLIEVERRRNGEYGITLDGIPIGTYLSREQANLVASWLWTGLPAIRRALGVDK